MSFWSKIFSGMIGQCLLRNDPVFIIGVHRSGTSALSGALEHLGLSVGRTVMPPSPDNPLGYYENNAITDLHDRFLAKIKESWSSPHPIHPQRFSGILAWRYQRKLKRLLVKEFGQERPLIKDPRLCQLLPLWMPLIKKHFTHASFVLPIRHPLEVAASMRKRDNFTMGHGLALWTVSALEGERATRAFTRCFTTYEKLLANPTETIAEVARKLGLPRADSAKGVSQRIDPSLRHHANPQWPENEPHRELVLGIYEAMIRPDKDMESRLDTLREQYYRARGVSF